MTNTETEKVVLKNVRTNKILEHRITEVELIHKCKTELAILKHKHIMEELEFMKKNNIKTFER